MLRLNQWLLKSVVLCHYSDMPDSSCHPPFSVPRLSHHGQFSSLLPLLLQVLYSPLPREVLPKRWDLIEFGIIIILKEGGREEGRREEGREERREKEGSTYFNVKLHYLI